MVFINTKPALYHSVVVVVEVLVTVMMFVEVSVLGDGGGANTTDKKR